MSLLVQLLVLVVIAIPFLVMASGNKPAQASPAPPRSPFWRRVAAVAFGVPLAALVLAVFFMISQSNGQCPGWLDSPARPCGPVELFVTYGFFSSLVVVGPGSVFAFVVFGVAGIYRLVTAPAQRQVNPPSPRDRARTRYRRLGGP